MSFSSDVIRNFIANVKSNFVNPNYIGNVTNNFNNLLTGFIGAKGPQVFTQPQLFLIVEQAFVSFATGANSLTPGGVSNVAYSVLTSGLLLAFEVTFAPFAAEVAVPIILSLLIGSAVQAVFEASINNNTNNGFGDVLTTHDEIAALSTLALQYSSDVEQATYGPLQPNASLGFRIPGNVLTLNFDPATWVTTFSSAPPGGLGAQGDIVGRSQLVDAIYESVFGVSPQSIDTIVLGTIDPYLTQILVDNQGNQTLRDSGTATAFNKQIGEVLELGSTSGSTFAPTGQSLDIMIARGTTNTLDFGGTAPTGSGLNLLELTSGGALNIQSAQNANTTVVYDPTGSALFNINSTANQQVTIYEVMIPDLTAAAFLLLNAATLNADISGGALVLPV